MIRIKRYVLISPYIAGLILQAFVIHFDGFKAAIYFATFSAMYLRTIRSKDLAIIQKWEKTSLNHTKLYDLYDSDDRTDFIREFVAVLRFVSCGEANIGHLRKNGTQIHRMMSKTEEVEDGPSIGPPQWELDNNEQLSWTESEVYGSWMKFANQSFSFWSWTRILELDRINAIYEFELNGYVHHHLIVSTHILLLSLYGSGSRDQCKKLKLIS